jgi:hypothetical protein
MARLRAASRAVQGSAGQGALTGILVSGIDISKDNVGNGAASADDGGLASSEPDLRRRTAKTAD